MRYSRRSTALVRRPSRLPLDSGAHAIFSTPSFHDIEADPSKLHKISTSTMTRRQPACGYTWSRSRMKPAEWSVAKLGFASELSIGEWILAGRSGYRSSRANPPPVRADGSVGHGNGGHR